MAPTPALRSAADHRHADAETCPYCEQAIPNDRAEEIRARFESKKRQDEAAANARVEQRVADARRELDDANRANTEKLQEQYAATIAKLQFEAAARESAAVDQAKKAAEAEAQQKLDALTATQAAAAFRAEEAERERAAAAKQLETLQAQQDAMVVARTAEARVGIEKSKADEINALKAGQAEKDQKVAAQIAKLTEDAKALQQRLEAQEGEGADVKLYDVLRKKFPKDDIRVVKKSDGADIIHDVKHNKKHCGTIVYDSRNRNAWNPKFASNLRRDLIAGNAVHAILTSSKFPDGGRHVCIFDGVIVANPARVGVIAEILRDEVVRGHGLRLSEQNRERKTMKLYNHISSERFNNVLEALTANDDKLLALDETEKIDHKNIWNKRQQLITRSQKLHGDLRGDIDRIIDTEETD